LRQIIISLLSSSNGPLQPTKKISYQDIKVGIPNTMLCIEMAIFAVMHIFAFPWKEYSLKHKGPLDVSGSGYSGAAPRYQGGPLGLKALADAFNPWDIVKASARGFRWLFVGYKKREQDPSYQNPKLGGDITAYTGVTYAGNGEAATELRQSNDERGRMRGNTLGNNADEDDRAGLLRHSAQPGQQRYASASPYRPNEYSSGDDSRLELGAASRRNDLDLTPSTTSEAPNPSAYGAKAHDFGQEPPSEEYDSGYHPGIGPSGVHPAYRGDDEPEPHWDHWSGAQRSDQESIRPPTYRTNDPHG
jgi:hypothetical protein